ncbi:MAG: hypothetical protein RIR18_1053 [Pseudomonadota bacterium]|jgi:hypothetical protein
MAIPQHSIATVDGRSFFEQTLAYGVEQSILTEHHLKQIKADGPKGIVQIANHFGTAYLHTSLETAATRMVNLISLYLEDKSDSNLLVAAHSLRDNSLLSHSRGGSEMLKRLNALPLDTHLMKRQADPAEEKRFIDDLTFASPISLSEYRQMLSTRLETQKLIDFATWIAKQLKSSFKEYEDYTAEEIISSAMLVWYVGKEPLGFPTKSDFVKLVTSVRKTSFKPQKTQFNSALTAAPDDFRKLAESSMEHFVKANLPTLKSSQYEPVEFLFGDQAGLYFVRESLEEEVGGFDQLVSKEWVRVTKGQSDNASIATLFLLIATGHPPKVTLLKKEATSIIHQFRNKGFDANAVSQFIEELAPFEQRSELKAMWLEDLMPEAEIYLADPDEDDTYMERALPYLKRTCSSTWKGRG